MNHVDPAIFYRRTRTRHDDKFIMIFPGSFQWHQGLDIAIEALGHMKDTLPNAELHLYGGGNNEVEACLVELTDRLGLNGRVKFCGGVPFDKIADVIANADLGVVPKRADSFGNEAYSTKIMEFMSQGIPVVVSRTKIDTFYFEENVVHFFSSGDSYAMARAVMDIVESKPLREKLAAKGLEYADLNSWDRKKYDYLSLVDSLTTERF
jgi:glycosyltransferase involved in cell wall biosynthesis